MNPIEKVSRKEEVDECIQILLQVIIDDLRNNATEGEAGWRKPSEIEITSKQLGELFKLGIMENNLFGDIRINFRNKDTSRRLASFKLQFEQIGYFIKNREMIIEDTKKLQKAQEILIDLKEVINSDLGILPPIITIGLWKMLNTSEMSAIVDDILKGGFSPKDWAIISIRAASYLAVSIAQKIGKVESFGEAIKFIEKVGLIKKSFEQPILNEEQIQKVKKVLKWDIIQECLTEEDVKFIGISWFMFFLLESKDVLPLVSDLHTQILDNIKDTIEEALDISWEELSSNLENSISKINRKIGEKVMQEINWASDIIFMPEVF